MYQQFTATALFCLIVGSAALAEPGASPAPAPLNAPAPAPLVDLNPSCGGWSKAGECTKNPAYMHSTCAKSCSELTAAVVPPPAPAGSSPIVAATAEPKVAVTDVTEQNHQQYLKQQAFDRDVAAAAATVAASEEAAAKAEKSKAAKAKAAKAAATTKATKAAAKAEKAAAAAAAAAAAKATKAAANKAATETAASKEKAAAESVAADEPYKPVTIQRAATKKTTLLSTLSVAKATTKAATTLKSTLHLHDKRDQKDTVKAEDKQAHGQKLSWHEKALLNKKAPPAKPANINHASPQAAEQKYEAEIAQAVADNVAEKTSVEKARKKRQEELQAKNNQETQEVQEKEQLEKSGSWGNFILVTFAVLFLGGFAVVSVLQTEMGKQLASSVSGLMAGARMGSKSFAKVNGALHRAASGDMYSKFA